MTRRSIPDQDLACIAPLPRNQKINALESLNLGWPPYSYAPMRASILDIMNADAGPLAIGDRTPLAQIENDIRKRAARGRNPEDAAKANLQVARGLYQYAVDNEVRGRRQEFYPLSLGTTKKVSYWSPIVVLLEGRACVPFFDVRKTKKMTKVGKRFAFSAMHERIRASDPDFDEVAFAIVQFSADKVGPRTPRFSFDDEFDPYGFDELDAMTRETYELWYDILDGRRDEERRRGGTGSLL